MASDQLPELHVQIMDNNPTGESVVEKSLCSSRERNYDVRSPLPTRVTSACERCRRHKTRCDPFRPCSLCVRANVDCRPLLADQTRRDSLRKPPGSKRSLRNPRRQSQSKSPWVTTIVEPSQDTDSGTWNDVERSTQTHVTTSATRGRDADAPTGVRSSRPSIDYGEAESAMGIARKICELGSQHLDERTTSAIPGFRASTGAPITRMATVGQRLPISSILGQRLPPMELVYLLLEDYFDAIHWFSLAVYEPKFRRRLLSIVDGFAYPSQKPFLVLLVVMLGMAAWYRSQKISTDLADKDDDWQQWSADLLRLTESYLVELMDQHSVTAAQTCILLGSYHVYHGRPNLSFALLGATIRMSQAVGLHREPLRGDFEDIEERKRVWWTIYTWDRFASITYGRPLGINDKDCNVNMPADVFENPYFVASRSAQGNTTCYSTYQRELNRLYLIASPALETIFGSRTSQSARHLAGDEFVILVRDATKQLQRWRYHLPNHLVLDLKRDFQPHGGLGLRAHTLQSLSLQLTYDNLLIVLHRPFLAQQVDHLSTNQQTPNGSEVHSPINRLNAAYSSAQSNLYSEAASSSEQGASSDQWWNAAVRTSRVTELPILAQLATDSHLVAFLGINLFNAAIVLAIVALSDPLSDTAQVVKRTITRIFRLQDLLGKRSTLSKQSTAVLKNIITMLLSRESEAMLAPISGTSQEIGHQVRQAPEDPSLMSVEDTLRLPLDASGAFSDPLKGSQVLPDVSRALRINECLTSVQNVLAPGDDRGFNMPFGGGSHEHHESLEVSTQPHNVWQLPVVHDRNGSGVPQETVEDTYPGNGDGGLYWLWDMTWNETDSYHVK